MGTLIGHNNAGHTIIAAEYVTNVAGIVLAESAHQYVTWCFTHFVGQPVSFDHGHYFVGIDPIHRAEAYADYHKRISGYYACIAHSRDPEEV